MASLWLCIDSLKAIYSLYEKSTFVKQCIALNLSISFQGLVGFIIKYVVLMIFGESHKLVKYRSLSQGLQNDGKQRWKWSNRSFLAQLWGTNTGHFLDAYPKAHLILQISVHYPK